MEKTLFFLFQNGRPLPCEKETFFKSTAPSLGVFPEAEFSSLAKRFFGTFSENEGESVSYFVEKQEGILLLLPTIDRMHVLSTANRLIALVLPRRVLLCTDDESVRARMNESFFEHEGDGFSVLLKLLQDQTFSDEEMLERLEADVSALEDSVLSTPQSALYEIVALRRKLTMLKKHFDRFLNAVEQLSSSMTQKSGKAHPLFPQLEKRLERLLNYTIGLRESVTQVREAYQAQMDISLNRTMKLFTAITAAFLPLTVVTGWYGMNLKMPEAQAPITYPIVIGACVLTVVGIILFFRKRKWF